MSELPSGTITFLYTDIESSTPLWEKIPDVMGSAITLHNTILREVIEANDGVVFKIIGDAFQAAFQMASQRLTAAIEIQRRLATAEWPEACGPLKVRISLHVGPAVLDDSGDYAASHTLNRVGRVMSAGHGGQILLSQEAQDLTERCLPAGVSVKDMGEYYLKGLSIPEHLYQVVAPVLLAEFPPLFTSTLHSHARLLTTKLYNNNELVATWGNLANRMLSFATRHWEGHVPQPGELRAADNEILATVEKGFETVGEHIDGVRLRFALFEAIRLATEVNKYLDKAAPWFEIKSDKDAAATTVFTALRAIDSLKTLLAPFLPFTSERLHHYLGYSEPLFGTLATEGRLDSLGEHEVLRYLPGQGSGTWQPSRLLAGQALGQPEPLFRMLDDSLVEEERARLGVP